MKYKLICIDLDGTLLNDKNGISDKDKNTLIEAEKAGITIALTTGRLYASAKYYANDIGIRPWIISSNGSYIREAGSEKELFKNPINNHQFGIICSIIEKYKLTFNFNTFDRVVTNFILPEDNTYVKANKLAEDKFKVKFGVHENYKHIYDIYPKGIYKALLYLDKTEEGIKIIQNAKKELVEFNEMEIVSSAVSNIEVMAKGMTKESSIKLLGEKLGIAREKTMCIGDSENDITMIDYAGFGVAMENSIEELKSLADFITDSHVNSGVSKAIRRFAL